MSTANVPSTILYLFLILMVWLILDLLYPSKAEKVHGLYRYGVVLAALVYLMILSGGLVAGTNAGFAYNTFVSENELMLILSLSRLVLRLLESGISYFVRCSEIELSQSSSDISFQQSADHSVPYARGILNKYFGNN